MIIAITCRRHEEMWEILILPVGADNRRKFPIEGHTQAEL